MPFNGTGGFDPLPPPTYPAVAGEVIRAAYFNAVIDDLKAGLSQVLVRDGQAPITGNVDLTGHKFTNAANAATGQELTTLAQNEIAYLKRIVGAWLTSSESKERLYFDSGSSTYIRGHSAGKPVIFSNAAGAEIGYLRGDGRMALAADASAPEDVPRLGQLTNAADLKHSFQVADHGRWLLSDSRTIGNAASGGTARANADTVNLFTALWTACSNTDLVIQTSAGAPTTRGASAAVDFAADKRMPLPNFNGIQISGFHNGDGSQTTDTTSRLGQFQLDSLKSHDHTIPNGFLTGIGGIFFGGIGGNMDIISTTDASGGAENTVRRRSANIFISL